MSHRLKACWRHGFIDTEGDEAGVAPPCKQHNLHTRPLAAGQTPPP